MKLTVKDGFKATIGAFIANTLIGVGTVAIVFLILMLLSILAK